MPGSFSIIDNFGNSPLLEAIKSGHDKVASLLAKEGASLNVEEPGSFLCSIVVKGDSEFLKRVLSNGIDPNSRDYDHRTPLHVAASQGLYLMAKFLLDAGASVFSKDRFKICYHTLFCKKCLYRGDILFILPKISKLVV